MSDAQQALSYTVTADDRATVVFRGITSELGKLQDAARNPLQGISREWSALGSRKPLEFVKADQALVLAQTESKMAKLQKTVASTGVATKLQSAELDVLAQRHGTAQKAVDKTSSSHAGLTKVATLGASALLAGGVAVVASTIKQGIAWEDLGKKIEQETGLSGKSLKNLMGTINNITGNVPYKLGEVSSAAVLLKTKFGESDPQIEKTAGLLAGFAKRTGEETTPAVTGLLSIMQDYRQPLSDVVGLTDKLTSVSQATQKPMGELLTVVERYGPKLQAMGFGLNESIGLLGVFQESGISTSMMGRGLSQAVTTADKQLGVTASNPQGNPTEALEKEKLALEKAEASVDKYNETIPKTVTQQAQLARERTIANAELDKQREKYDSLKKSIEANGGAHATIASIIKGEIAQIEHAKSSQEAYSIATADFGKQIGPSFERAFYKNEAAIKAVDKALGEHGATQKLVTAEEQTLEGQLTKIDETWHKTERTLSVELLPAVGSFLKLISGGVDDIEKFTHGNASLAEALGAVATGGSAAFLARKPIGAIAKGATSLFSKVTGIGGGSGSGEADFVGITGSPLRVGMRTNPLAVWNVNETGGSGNPVGTAEKDVEKAGEGAGAAEAVPIASSIAAAAGTALAAAAIPAAGILAMKLVSPQSFGRNDLSHGQATGALAGAGSGSGLRVENGELKPNGGFGRTEANVAGGYEGPLHDVANTREQADAARGLTEANARLQQSQEALNSQVELGKKGSPEYLHVVKEVAEAETERRKALEALEKASSKGAYLTSSQKTQLTELRSGLNIDKQAQAFSASRGIIEDDIRQLEGELRAHPSKATAAAVNANYNAIIEGIGVEMQAGVVAVQQGNSEIDKALLSEAKVLGLDPSQVSSTLGKASKSAGATIKGAVGGLGFAKGGRVPGAVGPDNWTLVDPSGRPAAKVGGAELLIANRHTEADASRATMAVYGKTLGEMVTGETTPHSAATGGRFIADPGTNFTVGKEPQIVGDLEQLAKKEGWTIYGISGYRSPQHSVEVGGFANDPHTRGEAADVGINSNTLESAAALNAAMLAGVGLERPFYPASPHEINHVQLLGSGIPGGARESVPGLTTAVAQATAAAKKLTAPAWHGPGGLIGAIGKAAVARTLKGANARLKALVPSAGASADLSAVPGSGGSPSANEELGKRMMIADGWSSGEWSNLQALWTQESGWDANAVNPGSGAYGIPQALGHGHPYNLGDARAQIAWGLNYIKGRYGSPAGAEAHERAFNWYEKGGRLDYAGSFAAGGSVTASKPTMAIFGENGTETATFLPHAALGTKVSASGLAETPGNNPETGAIEYHTEEEWTEIRLQHTAKAKREAAYKKAHPKAAAPTYEDTVSIGGVDTGKVGLTKKQYSGAPSGNIDIPGDVSKLSLSVWDKVVASIEKTLKSTTDDRVATSIVGKLSEAKPKDAKSRERLQELTGKAITDSASSVVRLTKGTSPEEALGAGGSALSALKKLITDARRSNNTGLVGVLKKDTEWTFKWAASSIMRTASEAPAGQATAAGATAVSQLSKLLAKAQTEGRKTIELGLLKDVQKTVGVWSSATTSALSKADESSKANVEARVAKATLTEIHKGGAGTRVKAATERDPQFLKEEESNNAKAIAEYQKEQVAIGAMVKREQTLLKRLDAKMRAELKKHHKAAAHTIQLEINQIQAALGEAQGQMEEVSAEIASVGTSAAVEAAEHLKAVYEAFKEGVEETVLVFETERGAIGTRNALEEGTLHREGKDFTGLGELKTEQEGVLTPSQIAQANQDLVQKSSRENEEIASERSQRGYDESVLPQLSGEDRTNMVKSIEDLTRGINELENQIYDQTKETKKLTEATNQAAQVYGGTVGFNFNGQDYTVGGNSSMSSASAPDISVGI